MARVTSLRGQQDRSRRVSSFLTCWRTTGKLRWSQQLTETSEPLQPQSCGVEWRRALGLAPAHGAEQAVAFPDQIAHCGIWICYLVFVFPLLLPWLVFVFGHLFYTLVNFCQFWEGEMSSDMSSPWYLWLLSPSLHLQVWNEWKESPQWSILAPSKVGSSFLLPHQAVFSGPHWLVVLRSGPFTFAELNKHLMSIYYMLGPVSNLQTQ